MKPGRLNKLGTNPPPSLPKPAFSPPGQRPFPLVSVFVVLDYTPHESNRLVCAFTTEAAANLWVKQASAYLAATPPADADDPDVWETQFNRQQAYFKANPFDSDSAVWAGTEYIVSEVPFGLFPILPIART